MAVSMPTHLTLAGPVHVEPDPIKRSRFLGDAAPAESAEEAMAFVHAIREQHPDAGHHCYAYRLGAGDDGFRVSDDGEPGGTAGQPILNHIDGAGLSNVVVVVTRFFGGTKLGKGGLIRAYGGTAGAAIAAGHTLEVREMQSLWMRCTYRDQGTVEGVVRSAGAVITASQFGTDVTLTISVPTECVSDVRDRITESTAGRIVWLP